MGRLGLFAWQSRAQRWPDLPATPRGPPGGAGPAGGGKKPGGFPGRVRASAPTQRFREIQTLTAITATRKGSGGQDDRGRCNLIPARRRGLGSRPGGLAAVELRNGLWCPRFKTRCVPVPNANLYFSLGGKTVYANTSSLSN